MADKQLIDRVEHTLYRAYDRFPVVFGHGQGVKLHDTEDNEHLNFGAGIAVAGLGYGGEEYTRAVEEQLHKPTHTSNLFYNQPAMEAEEKLLEISQMDKVFSVNSETEAIEGVLKIAKRYHYNKLHEPIGDGTEGCEDADANMTGEVIAMNHPFHGCSLGVLSIIGNAHYQEPFKLLIPDIRFAGFSNPDSVKALVNDKTCAVIMEAIQGEEGIYLAEEEFIKSARALCDGHDLLLILDGIQRGMRRSGEMFAWQHYDVKPDVVIVARALGNGPPVGTFLTWGKAADAMVSGNHGTIYGGNPLVTAGVSAILDLFEKHHMMEHVRKIGAYLAKKLDGLVNEFDVVRERWGMSLIQGLRSADPAGSAVSDTLLEQRLALVSAGTDIICSVPPLVIREGGVDEVVLKLRRAIKTSFQRKEMIRGMLREKNGLPGVLLFSPLLGRFK